jgi:hypothetical protein
MAICNEILPPESLSVRDGAPEFVKELWKLLNDCWKQNPKDRPSVDRLKEWINIHKDGISGLSANEFVLIEKKQP